MIMISRAIRSLYPTSEFAIENEDIDNIRWFKNQPAGFDFGNGDNKEAKLAELLAEIERLNQLDISNAYQRARVTQYPKIADQLDMLWHAIDSGSLDKDCDFYKTLKAVKDANPKS